MANSLTSSGITVGTAPAGTSTISKIVDFSGGGTLYFGSNATESTTTNTYTAGSGYSEIRVGEYSYTLPSVNVGYGASYYLRLGVPSFSYVYLPSGGSYRYSENNGTSVSATLKTTTGYTPKDNYTGYNGGTTTTLTSSSGGTEKSGGATVKLLDSADGPSSVKLAYVRIS